MPDETQEMDEQMMADSAQYDNAQPDVPYVAPVEEKKPSVLDNFRTRLNEMAESSRKKFEQHQREEAERKKVEKAEREETKRIEHESALRGERERRVEQAYQRERNKKGIFEKLSNAFPKGQQSSQSPQPQAPSRSQTMPSPMTGFGMGHTSGPSLIVGGGGVPLMGAMGGVPLSSQSHQGKGIKTSMPSLIGLPSVASGKHNLGGAKRRPLPNLFGPTQKKKGNAFLSLFGKKAGRRGRKPKGFRFL